MLKVMLWPILLALGLAGCESMSVSECKVADWGRLGFSDAARGDSDSRLTAYTEDCAKAGVSPNAQAYRQGWDAGIVHYCTPINGWNAGVEGQGGQAAVCRGQAGFEAFSHYLNAGLEVHRTLEQMHRNASRIAYLLSRLEDSGVLEGHHHWQQELRDLEREQYFLQGVLARQQMLAP